jgi:hypothetical protein
VKNCHVTKKLKKKGLQVKRFSNYQTIGVFEQSLAKRGKDS